MLKALLNFFTGGGQKEAPAQSAAKTGSSDLAGFVEYVAKSMVDSPDDVHVTREDREGGFLLKIDCRQEDIGKIVGKRGKTIMAIRSLVSGAAGRMHQRVSVEVVDVH